MLVDETPGAANRGRDGRHGDQQQRADGEGGVAVKSRWGGRVGAFAVKPRIHCFGSLLITISLVSCQPRPSSARILIRAGIVVGMFDAKLMSALALAPGGQARAFKRNKFARRMLHGRGASARGPSH